MKSNRIVYKLELLGLVFLLQMTWITIGQQLSPPYYNLAQGKNVIATATCGEGVREPELFCELTGANPHPNAVEDESHIIRGQICDYCDPYHSPRAHPAYQAVDGTQKWWQSPPLSRGLEYNEINFTIPFGQVRGKCFIFFLLKLCEHQWSS